MNNLELDIEVPEEKQTCVQCSTGETKEGVALTHHNAYFCCYDCYSKWWDIEHKTNKVKK